MDAVDLSLTEPNEFAQEWAAPKLLSMEGLHEEVRVWDRVIGEAARKVIDKMLDRAYELGQESVATSREVKADDLYVCGTAYEIRMPDGSSRWAKPQRVTVHRRLP